MTAPLPGIRPGQIWQSRQLRKGGVHQRVLVTGGGMGNVYVNVLGEHDTVVDHRNLAREGFEERYVLVSEPGAVIDDA